MKKIVAFCLITLMAVFMLGGCGIIDDGPPQATEQEILLEIRLDVKEDIGLLVIDSDLGGIKTSGGISNADRTLLKHDEVLYWSIEKEHYQGLSTPAQLTLSFRVITEYCDPNYENIYPEELTVFLDPVSFEAEFGKNYSLTITGDKTKGFRAEFIKD